MAFNFNFLFSNLYCVDYLVTVNLFCLVGPVVLGDKFLSLSLIVLIVFGRRIGNHCDLCFLGLFKEILYFFVEWFVIER